MNPFKTATVFYLDYKGPWAQNGSMQLHEARGTCSKQGSASHLPTHSSHSLLSPGSRRREYDVTQ